MSKRGLPWLQFYPADWESDSISGCSLAAQGLWLRMMFVMHTSRRYGYLEVEGKSIPDEMMFRRCGCLSVEEYRGLVAELFAAGVPSKTENGVIYSRRMVRDQNERDSGADRQRRHRHGSVTPMSQGEVRCQKSVVRDQRSEKEKPTPTAPAAPGVCEELFAFWNDNRGALPKALKLTKSRRSKVLTRIKSDPNFPKIFMDALLKARQTPFCCGATGGTWRASFDWMIESDENAVKVLEGKYGDGKGGVLYAEQRTDENLRATGLKVN